MVIVQTSNDAFIRIGRIHLDGPEITLRKPFRSKRLYESTTLIRMRNQLCDLDPVNVF
jgi:hypothetical protein